MDGASNNNKAPVAIRYLPEDYEPTQYDVLCGRGKKCFVHAGNQTMRDLVQAHLPKYSVATCKMEKGHIISLVYEEICDQAGIGGFIKKDDEGRWYDVGEFLAREKVSQAFRDALQDKYKSSTASKKKRRELLVQSAELHSQRSLCSLQEPTLEDLERIAIEQVQEQRVSSHLLNLLDQDIKHAFVSQEKRWEGYNPVSFRGVNEVPVVDQRQEKLQAYRQPCPGHYEVNRSCPVLAWKGSRSSSADYSMDDYEPLHHTCSDFDTDMDASVDIDDQSHCFY
mmetsp:Transcript_1079/g.2288  ORF Transcript_1079/g.2288 Transcript_1079/m.2288 type:complete len:281 (-) Transcript_1079:100-942(-)|eukprot:scaffold31414_cov183-Amphora_coffeaeformis.AAC.2